MEPTRFELDYGERIAGGGFADVYRAVRRDTRAEVAVKVLRDFKNLDSKKRFRREVKTLEMLNGQEGIMPLLGYNLDVEKPFYVMPLMKGGTLARHAGKLAHGVVRALLRRFAGVLQRIHVRGGLHRDFKPANVLIDEHGNAALGDFGLGNDPQVTAAPTARGCGTPGYMAPELGQPSGTATTASDVFSLGATAFELLTGVPPAQTQTLDVRAHNPEVPDDLRDLVLRMVHIDPSQRPTTQQLLDALPVGQPDEQPLVPPIENPPPRPRGVNWRAVGQAVAFGVATAAAAAGLVALALYLVRGKASAS